ncbi:unnamed protein product, partial [marine sediment metagenome]
AQRMQEEILKRWNEVDYLFMSAAVSDFTPVKSENKKIKKKKELTISLKKNIDILLDLKNRKSNQIIVGFSLDTDNQISEAKIKLNEKGIDLMIANDLSAIGSNSTSGFLLSKEGEEQFECSKDELSWKIIEKISSKKR